MSKQIKDNYELRNVCRSAGLSFVGSFMGEFLDKREMWSNPDTKEQFIAYMYSNYSQGGWDNDIKGTRTRVNCVIRIIESNKVVEALELVLNANDNKLGCSESKINAQFVLDGLQNGLYKLN